MRIEVPYMSYRQISIYERENIYYYFNIEKLPVIQIAKILRRNKSTIYREIERNTVDGYYSPIEAQNKYKIRTQNKFMFKRHFKYEKFTEKFLEIYNKQNHGVKATCYKIGKENFEIIQPSWRQVFRWIKTNRWVINRSNRLRRYYKKGGKRSIGIFSKFNNRYVLPYWTRPNYINNRLEIGHYELDTIIGMRSHGHDNVMTFTERLTRKSFTIKVKSKAGFIVNQKIEEMIKSNSLDVKTITIDNGIEFQKIGILAKRLNFIVYVCEPYASYQRGSNEHFNGLIRRFYKKGTDFSLVSNQEILDIQNRINNMPREMFGWKTASDMFEILKTKA